MGFTREKTVINNEFKDESDFNYSVTVFIDENNSQSFPGY